MFWWCSSISCLLCVYVVSLAGRSVCRSTSLQGISIHKHTVCCCITGTYNKVFIVLTYNFSKEQYVLPEDDLRIETCRSVLNVLV
jgi:uncharacterized membrane protein